ncbi:MAG: Ig-like domain-containing protein [Lachnospiraceae bacterium]|nr:Ig-like domain-containing protein [Lachnospiraceae bacterium]
MPIILSVAMVLETAPVTALATETVEETALEETKTGDGNDDAQDTNDDAQNEAGNTPENGDTNDDERMTAKEGPEEPSENVTQTTNVDAKDDNVENTAENAENTVAVLDTKIVVDESALRSYCNSSSSYQYDIDKKIISVKYDENNADPFANLLTSIKSSYIKVEVDGNTNASLAESLKYQWQKADGADLAVNAAPTEAGDYTLMVTLDAVENTCAKAETKLSFTIAKRQLSVDFPDAYEVVPGTTVGAFKKDFRYPLRRERTSWKATDTEDVTDEKTTYIDSDSITVYDAYRMETPLADDVKFLEGTDYVVSVKPVLKQTVSLNYAISEETVLKIKSYGRIETWIEVAQKNPEEQIAKVYDETREKQISYETEIKNKLTAIVKAGDENTDEGVAIDNAAVTEVWFDGAKKELGEGAAFEPQTAGTYYLGFRYYPTEDDAKIYKACKESDYIRVVIERAPLTLAPALKDGAEVFYTGMSETDVLKYADYTLLNEKSGEVKIDRDTFWGVSYDDISDNGTTNTRQSYEPVFRLIRAEKDASGNPVKDETTQKEIWTENNNEPLEASKYCYRLVFTGKKTVYTKAGIEVSNKRVSVNGSDVAAEDKNHTIVITEEALAANYAVVPVADVTKTKIDVTGILQQNFNTTNLNDLYNPTKLVSKVYDGKTLYASPSRNEYKKAVVTSTDGQEVAKNYDSAIRYTWYKINSVKAVYDETGSDNPVQTGWEVDEKSQVGGTSNNIPTDAGEYMLGIVFQKTGYETQTEKIYYRIEKQLLVVDIGEIPGAYKNQTISDYTRNVHYDGEYNVYVVPDNEYTAAFQTEQNRLDWFQTPFDGALNDAEYQSKTNRYKLNWYVEQAVFDENDQPAKDENGKQLYTKLSDADIFKITGSDTYRLGVTLAGSNSNYTNYEIVYDAEMSPTPTYTEACHNAFANIAVYEEQIGTVAIAFEIDAEKLATTKEYDGKPFYASENEAWDAIQEAFTAKTVSTGEVYELKERPQFAVTDLQMNQKISFSEMVYGGDYTVTLYLPSDATYRFTDVDIAYTINKRALTVTPVLAEDIPAGTNTKNNNDGIIYNLSKTLFSGYVEADVEAFQYGTPVYTNTDNGTKTLGFGAYAYDADEEHDYNTLSATVSKEGTENAYNGYIKYGKEYAVKFAGTLAYPYSRNYDVTYARTIFSATRRGNSTAGTVSFEGASVSTFARRVDGAAVIIIPTNDIPYIKDVDTTDNYENPISGEGNYFAIRINAPYEFREDTGSCLEEYTKNFIYRSSIEAAGGFILETKNNYIEVVFPVKERTAKSFDIIWENGYTENYTIDFTNAVLAEDLTGAVAPKSLSFNGVNTKMAVGDEQQLDVKIKKAQINDVIYIDYEVIQGKDVISVATNDNKKIDIVGYATALKPGKATITAVPVKLVNGIKTKIDGAKTAKITITVSDVTAPAIKKAVASDKNVTFTYTKPSNGYRREIYILEGKKKAEDFETLIRSINNGQWQGIFAVQPQYYVNEQANAKTKTVEKKISGLSANGEYTIYVRNVSGIRTLEDGSCVQLSAKGTVKTFKTTMPQVEALRLYAKNDVGDFVDTKDVKLTDKTEQLYTEGRFSTIDIDAAADTTDKSWLTLPLDKTYKKTFAAPKLVYAVSSEPDGLDEVDVSDIRDFRNYTYIGDKYYKKTDIATVDKTGKVMFKGVGKVYVIVYDQAAKEKKAQVTLNIYAVADSIKAKDTKLAVGKGLYLSSLLTYSEGKTAITGMDYQNTGLLGTTYKPNLTISAEEVTKINNEGNFYLEYTGDGDYYIYAKKPNAVCSIALNDGTLSASLKIQSTPIEPVKDLKITNIADDRFTISFSYPVETYLSGVKYRVNITDARGSLVASPRYDAVNYTSYDGKKKMFTRVVNYQSDRIVRLSKYNVSVTTLCAGEASAKPVKKAVKTTDFPASYSNLGSDSYGGATVYIYSIAGSLATYNTTLRYRDYLTSGNTYTLRAAVTDNANYRMTDTVTWKSSNPKVATVKAKAGTYTAQLNALKPGVTEIEVTSKITKKVFARWPVFVKAVGNAETYYGNYEFTWEYPFRYDPYYTSGMEVLTLQNPVRVTASELDNADYDYKWVKFTAPAFGTYQFNCEGDLKEVLCSSETRRVLVSDVTQHYRFSMREGETFYFKVCGAFTIEVSDYTKQGASFTVDDGYVPIDSDSKQIIAFRATEDNVYSFYSKELPNLGRTSLLMRDENNNLYPNSDTDSGKEKYNTTLDGGIWKRNISLSMGELVYLEVPAGKYTLYVEKRNASELVDGATLTLTDKVKEQWYTYTAAEDGLYTFRSKDATSALTVKYYDSLKKLNNSAWNTTKNDNDFSGGMTLKAGQKIVLRISASEAATATIIVTPEIPVKLSVGEEKNISVNADSRRWVTFTLPDAGRYRFSAVPTEPDAAYDVNLRYYQNAIEENEITTIEKNEIIVSDHESYDPDVKVGDTVYVEITTNKEGSDAANVKVSLTQVTATELTIGEELSITAKNGEEYWYTFTPPQKGNYIVQSVVTPNVGTDGEETDTHTLSAFWYIDLEHRKTSASNKFASIGTYDFYGESIGYSKQRLFKVSADDLGLGEDDKEITTTATIVVKELTATPLEMNTPLPISLLRNERKWYSFTAPETDTYIFKRDMEEGSVYSSYSDEIKGNNTPDMNSDLYAIDLEAGQTIYIQEHEDKGGVAKFTRSVELPAKLSGDASESVEVTKESPAYYMYTAAADTRYVISYTVDTADADATVSYGHNATADTWKVANGYQELSMDENERYYFRVSTTSETPVNVTLRIAPVKPVELKVGATENIPVAACGESSFRGRYTWCSFTAPEAGRYIISKKSTDLSNVEFYNEITNSSEIDNFQKRYYEAGETIYVALYTTSNEEQSTSITVQKIEFVQMEGDSIDETFDKEHLKEYSYTAKNTGLYIFTSESGSYFNKLYMDITDNEGVSVSAGSTKTMFLKKDDTVYIGTSSTNSLMSAKFTIALADEPQNLLVGENKVDFGEKNNKLTAISIPESGFYNIEIVYSGEDSVGFTGIAYYMKNSQIIGADSALYSSASGSSGSIAFHNKPITQDEIIYLYIPKPSSATGATITITKTEELIEAEMLLKEALAHIKEQP